MEKKKQKQNYRRPFSPCSVLVFLKLRVIPLSIHIVALFKKSTQNNMTVQLKLFVWTVEALVSFQVYSLGLY